MQAPPKWIKTATLLSKVIKMEYRSTEIDKIMAALATAQGTYKPLVANEEARGGKFANLQAIIAAVKESLASNGLAFFQQLEIQEEGNSYTLLKTFLGHSSGQWICSMARIIPEKTDRSTGNKYEIYKRLHALMLLGIAPSSHDPIAFDDNGDELKEMTLIEELKKPNENKKTLDRNDVITNENYKDLLIELEDYEDIASDILTTYGIETLADIPREEYHKVRAQILRIKKTHDDYNKRRK